jgi:hypothetical protein
MENNSFDQVFGDEQSFQDFEFDTYAEFNDSGATTSVINGDVSSINYEEYAFPEMELDAQYRSIQAINPNSYSQISAPSLKPFAPPTLSRGASKGNRNQSLSKAPIPIVVKQTHRAIVVPELPFDVAMTQFETNCNIDTVVSFIEHELKSILEISYEFYHEKCRWECVYLCGASRCKFEFNVFKNGGGSYIVEGNRLFGEGFPFSGVFRSIKAKFTGDVCLSPKSIVNFQCTPLSESSFELSDSEINDAILPVIAMAESSVYESKVNAAQIFCDLSQQENMLEVLCRKECINALVGLSRIEFHHCSQHALCALANLSTSWSCQEALRDDETFLQQLLELCRCGCHNTAEMRRECARLLANLCSAKPCAMKIFQSVGESTICRWMDTVDDFSDERLRIHAQRAKDALSTCLV